VNLGKLLAGEDPVAIAKRLLGCELRTTIDGETTSGRITETEAYWAPDDRASHAFGYRRTPRTEVFYHRPGTAYVYLIYGLHELFNVITGPEEVPHAVLIRAVEPVTGLPTMLRRRKLTALAPRITRGPGTVSQALGISRAHTGVDLLADTAPIRLLPATRPVDDRTIVATPRIGIDGAGEQWAAKPWRFYLGHSPYVSRRPAPGR
jgi:DNA-3-methyladenine glycosylase